MEGDGGFFVLGAAASDSEAFVNTSQRRCDEGNDSTGDGASLSEIWQIAISCSRKFVVLCELKGEGERISKINQR